jgi:3-methyladenine DNA glycosylase/8-oxoguanine DNA glycosylase
METFTMVPRGPFSLASSIRFLEGFTPEQLTEITENWRPYRTWVTLLLRTQQDIPATETLNCG